MTCCTPKSEKESGCCDSAPKAAMAECCAEGVCPMLRLHGLQMRA